MAAHLDWALAYARLGWRMLPVHWLEDGRCCCAESDCRSPGKHALIKDWPGRATTNPDLLERWATRWPHANWAVATGARSAVLVLDVDADKGGERSLIALERQHGLLPEIYPMQWTGSGAGRWQAFFAFPAARRVGNSTGALGPGLDIRGNCGYALVPPSVTLQPYEWAADRAPWNIPPEPPPAWLIDLLDPPAQQGPPSAAWNGPRSATDDRYLVRALEAELALVASAPNGRRNDQLNESAFNLFRFAAEGRLAAGAIAHGLEAAALHAGLEEKEIKATMKSAAAKRGVVLR